MANPRVSRDITLFNRVTAATNTSGPMITTNRFGKNLTIFHSMTGQTSGGYIKVEFAPEITPSAPNAPIPEAVVWFAALTPQEGTIPAGNQTVNYQLFWAPCPSCFIRVTLFVTDGTHTVCVLGLD